MKATAYVRVSSGSQSTAMQRARIRAVSRARGDNIVQWFSEKVSAGKLERTELGRVRELARQGQIRKLYVYKLDRVCRSGARDMLNVIHEFRSYGCTLVSCDDPFNLEDGPVRDMVIGVLGAVAQMELQQIRERQAAARARATTWGRPRRLTEGNLRQIRELRRQRGLWGGQMMTVREIAVKLKIPKSTVARALSQKGESDAAPKPAKKRVRAPLSQ